MTMVEAVILLGFGVPIAAACTAFVVMACRMQNEENAKLAAQHKLGGRAANAARFCAFYADKIGRRCGIFRLEKIMRSVYNTAVFKAFCIQD